VLLALGVGGGVLAATLGGGEEPKSAPPGAQQATEEGAQRESATSPERSAATPAESPARDETGPDGTSYEPYSPRFGGYTTVVPSDGDWELIPEREVGGGLRRTTIRGPRGIELWIDHTPFERAVFLSGRPPAETRFRRLAGRGSACTCPARSAGA
jgi:hypothetical protein